MRRELRGAFRLQRCALVDLAHAASDHDTVSSGRRRVDPAGELVGERAGNARMLLERSAGADDGHRSARRQLAVELDGGGVHGHGTDHFARFTADPHRGAGQVAPEPVRIADGQDPDPRLALGDEEPAVAGRLTGPQQLRLGELGHPGEHRLEPVLGRIGPERRQPVERDPAANGVEARFRDPERSGTVRHVPGQMGHGAGGGAEPLDLHACEVRVACPRSRGASSLRPPPAWAPAAPTRPSGPCPCRASHARRCPPGSPRSRRRARARPGGHRRPPRPTPARGRAAAPPETRPAARAPPPRWRRTELRAPASSAAAPQSRAPCP